MPFIDVLACHLHLIYLCQNPCFLDKSCNFADIVFVLDSSGSIGLDNWMKVLNFTKSVASGFQLGSDSVQIGVITYANKARIQFYLNTYNNSQNIMSAIDSNPWKDEKTNTSGGIRLMYRDVFTKEKGDRPGATNIGIVITDGESNVDAHLTIPEADNARLRNIKMFAIGIGDNNSISIDELRGIGDKPSNQFVFEAANFDALTAIREEVVVAACKAATGKFGKREINNRNLLVLWVPDFT